MDHLAPSSCHLIRIIIALLSKGGAILDLPCPSVLSCICLSVLLSFHNHLDEIFVTLFSVTVKSRELKLGTHLDSGWMYCVYQNHDIAAYLFLYFSICLYNSALLLLTFP